MTLPTKSVWTYPEAWVDVTAKAIRDHEAVASFGGNDPRHSDSYHRDQAGRVLDALLDAHILEAAHV